MFSGFGGYDLFRERHGELLREAELWRLGREARWSLSWGEAVRVRWGMEEDVGRVAGLLELDGAPRWVAFEERFIVAEREGELVGVLVYRTEPKRMRLGLLVADPWVGEERVAIALYRGAAELARELGVREVLARGRARHLVRSGYRPVLGGWWFDPFADLRRAEGRTGRMRALWGSLAAHFFRTFRR
ncbi:hypothetical protein RxyAA322_01750 [Rubrobacter xylanophilus]|uniref:N-acetyltransferase domain-containing protein n=1 Tax=Rubrobacter xylanophilus TaxID=49319 RepID=A0A510HEF3_9ACTN|nr:hypothetical protein [Rubrobacter xylanophilus]BBL78321.1 hypothetical protein RxyAA322_01750 [Rubrobacter xylanophilus]